MKQGRVVVTGLIGAIPLAGLTLHYLQYVRGLRDLGHEVLYLEDTGAWYYDPASDTMVDDRQVPLDFIKKMMDVHGLRDSWTFVDLEGEAHGVAGVALKDFLNTAELFINVTGAGVVRDEYARIPARAYVDTDPGYIQIRVANGSEQDRRHLEMHTAHFTFGGNIGAPDCLLPTVGLTWYPTVQPICLDLWPFAPAPSSGAPFTTLLKWHTYEPVEHRGEVFGTKNEEFMKFVNLPVSVGPIFEIATVGDPPESDLAEKGWRFKDGAKISSSIESYREYIQASRGEWSIAKNGYVKSLSGWFSDRSAAYLASGRPVILQSTGYERWLPTGTGVMEFSTTEEVQRAVDSINSDYERHRRAAREVAEEYFDSSKVLTHLLEAAMSSPHEVAKGSGE